MFYAPEFRVQAMGGQVVTRSQDIDAFASRAIRPELIENEAMQVDLYGAVAVTGIEHVRGVAFGRPGDFRLRIANILVCRNGGWRMVLSQSTPIGAPGR